MSHGPRWSVPKWMLGVALILGCDCSAAPPTRTCTGPEDCGASEVCVDERCVPRGEPDSGFDGGSGDDATTPRPDGGEGVDARTPSGCVPATCDDFDIDCGPAPDGCGGAILCGTCPSGQVCGGGADRGRCVTPACAPLSCGDYMGVNCGVVADGCGGLTESCGDCIAPEICGGGDTPNRCGGGVRTGPGCEGLCRNQVYCGPGAATTLSGRVFAPNGTLPLPNAVVYVPNAPLPAITNGISCERCEDEDLGAPLVGTVSDYDGTFELRHVPAGIAFPLVVKIGKWRRVVMIEPREPCSTTALTPEQTRLPRNRGEGDLPQIAVSTGSVDAMECVFRKLGVSDFEFTRPDGTGAIHLYRANGAWADAALRTTCGTNCTDRAPGSCSGSCPPHTLTTALMDDPARLASYDLAVFGCEATATTGVTRSNARRRVIRDYLDGGGRAFLSHYAYDWLFNNNEGPAPTLHTTAVWSGSTTTGVNSSRAFVDTGFPRGAIFWDWLVEVDAAATLAPPQIAITDPRFFVRDVAGGSRRWVHTVSGAAGHASHNSIQQYTFNTPVGAPDDMVCGRVVYSAFHVSGGSTGSATFPGHCSTAALTPQEKVLAFMLFDLATCVSGDEPPPPPTCTPRTCEALGIECGLAGDGCGGSIDCGPCPEGSACGAGGVPNVCSAPCPPLSCADHDAECGEVSDGCGGVLDCGDCEAPDVCGFSEPNRCGSLV
ncbi:MAG: hypothetical protein KF901_03745 [Myxococcales bacterium]|nr:hypothetical protein [Myxococcales bacterium]